MPQGVCSVRVFFFFRHNLIFDSTETGRRKTGFKHSKLFAIKNLTYILFLKVFCRSVVKY